MKTIISNVILGCIAIAAAIGAIYGMKQWGVDKMFEYKVETANPTLTDITTAEKLKVLTIAEDVMVTNTKAKSTGKLGFLRSKISNNEAKIVGIYPALVNIGFDFSKVDKDKMIEAKEDSLIVHMPAIEILNKDGKAISESEAKFPIQNGTWSSAELVELSKKANDEMLKKCQSGEYYAMATEQGQRIVKTMFESLGFDKIRVEIAQ